jgi:hypothetical protein
MIEGAQHALPTMEPDHVNETSSHDFTVVAACGDIRNSPGGLDYHGQELLA